MFDFNTFMAKVKQDNPSFKRFTQTSSLDPLIAQVRGQTVFPAASKARVERLIAFMPFQKQTEYKQALAYLAAQLGVRIGAIPLHPDDDPVLDGYLDRAMVGTDPADRALDRGH